MKRAVLAILGLLLATPAIAHADGVPPIGIDGNDGVVARSGEHRYVTLPLGRETLVERVRLAGGGIARYRAIPGRFAVPVVAYDGSTAGLSADDRTLVLIRPRPGLTQERTQLAVLDARRLLVERRITLRGNFSFDALSPDGRTAYLIEYRALTRHNFDPSNYRVRALDTTSGTLDPAPIVDPREPDEKMGGLPVTRTTGPDARWAYTLYSGSEHPFVHALDTSGRSARCIDLDALTGRDDLFQMRLRITGGGRTLEVLKGDAPVTLIDTRTFAVSEPRAPAAPRARAVREDHDDGGSPVWPWAVALGLLLVLVAASAHPLARATRAR